MTKTLGRILTAMVTPMNSDGTVNYPAARILARKLIESGSDGVVVVGTTGESPTLTKTEEQVLFAEITAELGGKYTVVAGTGSNNTAEAIKATVLAEEAGVDAALLVVPYYNKPTQEGLYQHFKAVAESTKLPCILYNVPSRTVVSLTADTVARLAKIKNIIGIKEASGNLQLCQEIMDKKPESFLVWSGDDASNLAIKKMGGYGVISVAAHLVGKQIREMLECVDKGDLAHAEELNNAMAEVNKVLFITANPQPVKYAMNIIGFAVGKPRLPMIEPFGEDAEKIKDMLKRTKIDFNI